MTVDNRWDERRSGRTETPPGNARPEEERDRSRVIHCSSFRRLQGKTQVLGVSESDFHRTRLTHSMEVAQIGRGIVLQLRAAYAKNRKVKAVLPTTAQIETICFGHDLGHPPFGHRGEIALNEAMKGCGGFEANGQSLRILTKLELHTWKCGLDLTRRSLLGVLKYPAAYSEIRGSHQGLPEPTKPPKCYLDTEEGVVDWMLEPLSASDRTRFTALDESTDESTKEDEYRKPAHMSFDASIMEVADDIAYGIHDFEDAVVLKLITQNQWEDVWEEVWEKADPAWAHKFELEGEWLTRSLFEPQTEDGNRKLAIGKLINSMVVSVKVDPVDFGEPLLAFRARLADPARRLLEAVTKLTRVHVIDTANVQTLEYRGHYILVQLFEALESDWRRLIPESFVSQFDEDGCDDRRIVCDFIAGMTDAYATRMYERLFVPKQGSVFERL